MKKSISNFKSCFILVFSVFICFHIEAQVNTTTLDPNIRDNSNLDIGFNRRSDNTVWWSDNDFINLVAEMNPDVVRYPGGTQANYWDWKTGQFIPNTDKVWGSKEVLTIPAFVNALPSRTKAVYLVNMARPTPITMVDVNASDAILRSDATLNLKIADMIDAIDEFDQAGKLPYAIELGNEFYFGNIESGIFQIVEEVINGVSVFKSGWDEANNQPYESSSKKDATDISALFYLEQSRAIVSSIKAAYPTMKFVLTTTKGGTSTRDAWNNTIFDNLEINPEFASLKNDIVGVTQHHYLNENYGVQTIITDNASAKIAIAEGIQYPLDKQADYDLVPNDYKIWYTEYGEVKRIAEDTWAAGVRYGALLYSWISMGDKVGQLHYQYISDNNVLRDDVVRKLAPIGIVQKVASKAFVDMTEMQLINFDNNPISASNLPSLYGYKLKNNDKETLFIVNISDTDFTQVQFDNLISYTGQPTMTQYYSNSPSVSGVAEGSPNIISIIEDVNNSVTINKFSVTTIEVDKINITYTFDGTWTPMNPSGISTSTDNINVISGNANSSSLNISEATEANSLTISAGAKLVINTGGSLIVENFDNQGTLTIRSNSTNFGTFIPNTITNLGAVDYRRFVNPNASTAGNDLISAPLHGEIFGDFAEYQTNENVLFNNPNNISQKLFGPFDKFTNSYLLYDTDTNDANITLDAGIGYRAASIPTTNNVLVFTGNIETGTVNVPIFDTGSQFSEWNLIGNPYTANVDFEDFFNVNKSQLNTGAFQAIYGYNATTNKWTIWNQLTIDDITIREVFVPGQGFLVPSKPDDGMIIFSPDMRRTGISDDFILNRSSANSNSALAKLFMTRGAQVFNTDVYFVEGQTTGLDIGYDAGAFNGNADGLFTHLVDGNEGLEMAIQTLPFTNVDNIIVPLGVKTNQGVQLSIGLDITNSTLPNETNVYLEDTENNTWTLLNTNQYTLTPNTDITGAGRFYLHFQPETLSTSENELDQINITVNRQTLHISGIISEATQLEIFDVLGRKTFQQSLESNTLNNTIDLSSFSSGIYIVHLKNKTQTKTQKVILN